MHTGRDTRPRELARQVDKRFRQNAFVRAKLIFLDCRIPIVVDTQLSPSAYEAAECINSSLVQYSNLVRASKPYELRGCRHQNGSRNALY